MFSANVRLSSRGPQRTIKRSVLLSWLFDSGPAQQDVVPARHLEVTLPPTPGPVRYLELNTLTTHIKSPQKVVLNLAGHRRYSKKPKKVSGPKSLLPPAFPHSLEIPSPRTPSLEMTSVHSSESPSPGPPSLLDTTTHSSGSLSSTVDVPSALGTTITPASLLQSQSEFTSAVDTTFNVSADPGISPSPGPLSDMDRYVKEYSAYELIARNQHSRASMPCLETTAHVSWGCDALLDRLFDVRLLWPNYQFLAA